MRALITIFVVLFSFGSWAQSPKVVLLTSLMETQLLNRKKNGNLEVALEKKFRGHFKNSYLEIEVQHLTKPNVLWKTLNDPTVVGLIWVSHAKKAREISSNLKDPATVMDAFGNDVKNFFKTTSPNLRFLALVGCEGEEILKQFEDEGAYHKRPELTLKAFPKKVDARAGLTSSLKISQKALRENLILEEEILEDSHHLSFKAESSAPTAWVKVELGGEILGVISGNKKSFELPVTIQAWDRMTNRNIKITALKDETTNQTLPLYEIKVNGLQDLWKIFGKNGTPIGVGQNLYLWQLK